MPGNNQKKRNDTRTPEQKLQAQVVALERKLATATSMAGKAQTVKNGNKKKKFVKKTQRKGKAAMLQGNRLLTVLPKAYSPNQLCAFTVEQEFQTLSLVWAMTSMASYLAQFGQVNNVNNGVPLPWDAVYGGISYLLTAIGSLINGGTVEINTCPAVVNDLIAALLPKGVTFMQAGSEIEYGWKGFDFVTLKLQNFPVGDGIWAPTFVIATNNAYDAPAQLSGAAASADAYSSFQKLISHANFSKALKLVALNPKSSKLRKDVTSFARVYRYNGLNAVGVSTGSYYNDVENEVQPTAIMYGHFAEYATPDVRVPTKLAASSGDSQMCVGLPLSPFFVSPFNFVTPVLKVIDFEEIYTAVTIWMCRLKESIQTHVGVQPESAQPFNFTMQDFRIALRQMLMGLFADTQFFVQGVGPVAHDANANNFVPFLVMGSTFGSAIFNKFMLPELMVENLAALKGRMLKIEGKSDNQIATFLPILGRYWADTPSIPIYNLTTNGVTVPTPLFSLAPQATIRLTDGYGTNISPAPYYVDLNNSYYQGVLDDWNNAVTALQEVSAPCVMAFSDRGPDGLGVLHYTRVELHITDEKREREKSSGKSYVPRNTRWCKNLDAIRRQDSKNKLSPLIIPPASITELIVGEATCGRRLENEEEGLFSFLFTPSIRLNPDEDALTIQMYQTESKEPFHEFYANTATASGVGMYSRMADYAGICVTGLGKETGNGYNRLISVLRDKGQAGILANLLAPLAKSIFPGNDGIIDTVSAFLP